MCKESISQNLQEWIRVTEPQNDTLCSISYYSPCLYSTQFNLLHMNISFFSMGNKYFYFHFEVDPSPLIRQVKHISVNISFLVVSFSHFSCTVISDCVIIQDGQIFKKLRSLQQYQSLNFISEYPPPFLPPLKRGIKRTLFNESFVFI